MSITHAATISLGLKGQWETMMEYIAKSIIHYTVTTILDDQGQIIGITEVQNNVYGAISPVGTKTITESIGGFYEGDLVMYLMVDVDLNNEQTDEWTSITHYIEYQGSRYRTEKVVTGFDAGEAVVVKYRCRKVAI